MWAELGRKDCMCVKHHLIIFGTETAEHLNSCLLGLVSLVQPSWNPGSVFGFFTCSQV